MENISSIIYRRFVSDKNLIPVKSGNEIQIMIAIDVYLLPGLKKYWFLLASCKVFSINLSRNAFPP